MMGLWIAMISVSSNIMRYSGNAKKQRQTMKKREVYNGMGL